MSRSKQPQWDFGELFPSEETRTILTVSELTSRVKVAIEAHVGEVWVTGEISNLRQQASGHAYFSLKDDRAQLACVLFRGTRVGQRDLMEDGLKVVAQGDLTVYEPQGRYQLNVRSLELQGVGELQVRFDKLKQKLQREGLFDNERKRALPKYPQRIGVVTSLDAAALRDVLHVVGRRQSSLEVVIAPSRVQGQGAEMELARGVEQLNRFAESSSLDLILLTRGGGSIEDLWASNEEVLARAVSSSSVPVVSAVGHEIDFTICDFVSDVRAATPSAAAEIITEGAVALRGWLDDIGYRLMREVRRRLGVGQANVEQLSGRMRRCHPRRRLQDHMQRVDELGEALRRGRVIHLRGMMERWKMLSDWLRRFRPGQAIALRGEGMTRLRADFSGRMRFRLRCKSDHLVRLEERLRLLSPKNILARGYSITCNSQSGEIIRQAAQVKKGQRIRTHVSKGEFDSSVE